jgi:hypothetical protein
MSVNPIITPTPIIIKPTLGMGDIFIYVGIIALIIISIVLTIVLIKRRNKNKNNTTQYFTDFNVGKYAFIFFRFIGNKWIEVERVKMTIDQTKFRYKNKDFNLLDLSKPLFSDKSNNYYGFDFDTCVQLAFYSQKMPKDITTEDIDTYVNRGIIGELVKSLEEPKQKFQWVMLAVGIALGIAIGLIIGIFAGMNM